MNFIKMLSPLLAVFVAACALAEDITPKMIGADNWKQCQAAGKEGDLLEPEKGYSDLDILISLRTRTFSIGADLLKASKNESDDQKEERAAKIADFSAKLKILNALREKSGLKALSLAELTANPDVVYEKSASLEQLRTDLQRQKDKNDQALDQCAELIQKALVASQSSAAQGDDTKHGKVGNKKSPGKMATETPRRDSPSEKAMALEQMTPQPSMEMQTNIQH